MNCDALMHVRASTAVSMIGTSWPWQDCLGAHCTTPLRGLDMEASTLCVAPNDLPALSTALGCKGGRTPHHNSSTLGLSLSCLLCAKAVRI